LFGEKPDDDWIGLHDADHAALFNGHLDHVIEQQFPCLRPIFGRLHVLEHTFQSGELHLGDGEMRAGRCAG
jgi:hypothetical protein